MDDPHLEPIPIEAEVALHEPNEAGHGRVATNGPPAAAGAVSAREPRFETLLIGVAHGAIEPPPLRASDPAQQLPLRHATLLEVAHGFPHGFQ